MTDFLLFENALNTYTQKINENSNFLINKEFINSIECSHAIVTNDKGVVACIDCGKELEKNIYNAPEWRYYQQSDNKHTSDPNRVLIRKMEDRSIFKDVENMGFGDKIVSLANQIYLQVTKGQIYRGNSRKALIFASIFHSFKLQGKPQSHEKLIKIFELSRKISLKGLKLVNLNIPRDSPIHTTYITPINLIEDIMDKFSANEEQKKDVTDIYNKIKNKSSQLNRSRPSSISAGIIWYWISKMHIDISLKDFASKIDLSELTISKIAKEVANILGVTPESWL